MSNWFERNKIKQQSTGMTGVDSLHNSHRQSAPRLPPAEQLRSDLQEPEVKAQIHCGPPAEVTLLHDCAGKGHFLPPSFAV